MAHSDLSEVAISAAFLQQYHVEAMKQAANTAAQKDSVLSEKIEQNKAAIDVINGSGEGSMTFAANAAIAAALAGADESYDTLIEIANWISSHADSAAAMNVSINKNTTDISGINTDLTEMKSRLSSLEGSETLWADADDMNTILGIVTSEG